MPEILETDNSYSQQCDQYAYYKTKDFPNDSFSALSESCFKVSVADFAYENNLNVSLGDVYKHMPFRKSRRLRQKIDMCFCRSTNINIPIVLCFLHGDVNNAMGSRHQTAEIA